MAQVTAAMVKELRQITDAPMMECKKALVEADGDIEKAIDVLRVNGLAKAVKKVFDLRPGVLIEQLHLRNVKYAPLAAYGHFGRDELDLPWEKTDRIELLLHSVELLCGYRPNTHGVRHSRLERYGKGVLQ